MTDRRHRQEGEEKYRLLLQVAEAANSQLEMAGVLEAVLRALKPFAAVDGIAVVGIEGGRARLRAIHVEGFARRRGEAPHDTLDRFFDASVVDRQMIREGMPLKGSATEFVGRTGRAHVCQDLLEEQLFPEDARLAGFGIRSYVRAPLFVREKLIGSIAFTRFKPRPFSPEEAKILEEVSRPVALAVANSFAYAEIARLGDQLHQENLVLKEEIDQQLMFEEIIGSSPALRRVLTRIEKVAPTDSLVLITGETGTGKELAARAIHRHSRRSTRALIKTNLASLPPGLIASELFGHEKGAFTGAIARRIGRFEAASGGTIFLDEIGDLPAEMQVALLRVLQEGEFERVGGMQTIHTGARVIVATNRDLARAVEEGKFREDLYYRLSVFPIEMPPLRDRREDIPVLVEYYAARHGARLGRKIRKVDKKTMERLLAYRWPGNVRELQNVIERAVILAEGDTLVIEESALLGERLQGVSPSFSGAIEEEERELIESALRQTYGRVAGAGGAAARLKIPSTTLESKIKRLGIDKHRFKPAS